MNREIKFRGKRRLNGEWVYGNLVIQQKESHIHGSDELHMTTYIIPIVWLGNFESEVDPSTIGQYTGLKDSKGKEIYEGDILKTPRGFIGKVVFDKAEEECRHREYGRMIIDVYTTYGWCFRRADGYICAIDDSILNGEIIGNIHDNPELMKG